MLDSLRKSKKKKLTVREEDDGYDDVDEDEVWRDDHKKMHKEKQTGVTNELVLYDDEYKDEETDSDTSINESGI